MFVSVPEPAERERVADLARALGLEAPFEGAHLRLVGAACLFQDPAGRCRIHARFGEEAKPVSCRQFPLVRLETERGPRTGIDPCCYHAHDSARDAPLLALGRIPPRPVRFDGPQSAREAALLGALAAPGASVAGALTWLRRGRLGAPDRLPRAMASAWIDALAHGGLPRFVEPRIAGPMLRSALRRPVEQASTLRSWAPPPWPGLGAELEAAVLARVAELLRLRICATAMPQVDEVAGLALRGAVLLGWCDPTPGSMARGLAAWFRLMRAPAFSAAFLSPASRAGGSGS